MKAICPRCKQPAKDHAPWRSFCPLMESEVLYLIIELQQKSIEENAKDKTRLDTLDFYLSMNEWVELGFNRFTNMVDNSLTNEYYINGDNFAPSFREAIDLYFTNQQAKEEV